MHKLDRADTGKQRRGSWSKSVLPGNRWLHSLLDDEDHVLTCEKLTECALDGLICRHVDVPPIVVADSVSVVMRSTLG